MRKQPTGEPCAEELPHGSEGGEAQAFPTPISSQGEPRERHPCRDRAFPRTLNHTFPVALTPQTPTDKRQILSITAAQRRRGRSRASRA
jgi:hypothetical protein